MNGKQKLYFLLNSIDDAKEISPSGQSLIIDPTNDLNRNYREVELTQLFTKLEKDEQVLKVLKAPSRIKTIDFVEGIIPDEPIPENDDGCWHIQLLPAFDSYFLKIQLEPEYRAFSSRKPAHKLPIQINKNEKPNRKALEKIWNVLQEIEEKRQLGSDDFSIRLLCTLNVFGKEANEQFEDRQKILERLSSLGAISNLHRVTVNRKDMESLFWAFSIGDNYQKVFNNYEREYKESAIEYEQTKQTREIQIENPNPIYEITYTGLREILLNKIFQIAKPDFDSENNLVFDFLYKHPNKKYTLKEIEEGIGNKLGKTLHKIVENLGFKGDLRKIFIDVSGTSICFKNPVTKDDLEKIGITRIKLSL